MFHYNIERHDCQVFTLDPLEGFRTKTFAGHKTAVVGAYFSVDGEMVGGHYLTAALKLTEGRFIQSVKMEPFSRGNKTMRIRTPLSSQQRLAFTKRLQIPDGAFPNEITSINVGPKLFVQHSTRHLTSSLLVFPMGYSVYGRCRLSPTFIP